MRDFHHIMIQLIKRYHEQQAAVRFLGGISDWFKVYGRQEVKFSSTFDVIRSQIYLQLGQNEKT